MVFSLGLRIQRDVREAGVATDIDLTCNSNYECVDNTSIIQLCKLANHHERQKDTYFGPCGSLSFDHLNRCILTNAFFLSS